MVGVGPKRNPHAFSPGNFEQACPQILPISVAINLDCFIESGRLGENASLISPQTFAVIINARLRMP
jgi:hypothetical protein